MDVAIISTDHDFAELNKQLTDQAHIYILISTKELLSIYKKISKIKWKVHNLLYWREGEQLILMARKGKAYAIKNCGDSMVLRQKTQEELFTRFIENSLKDGKVYNDFI